MSGMSKAKDALAIRFNIIAGATIGSTNTVTGMTSEDTLLAVWYASSASQTAYKDITSTCTATTGGFTSTTNLSVQTGSAGDNTVFVLWLDNSL